MNTLTLSRTHLPNWRRRRTVVGLDIGQHSVKLVEVELRNEVYRVVNAASFVVSDADSQSAHALGARIASCVEGMGIRHEVICNSSLPSSWIDYETLALDGMPTDEDEMASIALDAIGELIGEELPNVSADCWITESAISAYDMHLVWTSSELAENVVRVASKSGLQWEVVDVPALALARVGAFNANASNRLIVDIGHNEVTFVWSRDGQADYVRNRIPFADFSASATLANQLGTSQLAAEELLRQYGIRDVASQCQADGTSDIAAHMHQTLDQWLEHLIFEIRRTCQFLQSRHGSAAVRNVVLCGGTASIAGLSDWLGEQLNLSFNIAVPPKNCQWLSAQAYTPLYAQALALALPGGVS